MACREALLRAGKIEEDDALILTHGNRDLVCERSDRLSSGLEVSEKLFAAEGLEGVSRQLSEPVLTCFGREASLQFVPDRTMDRLGVYSGVDGRFEAISAEAQTEQID